jgi:SM-20-related protein
MPPRYDFRIDGREVFVLDDVVTEARLGHLAAWFAQAPAQRLESDSGDPELRGWSVPLETDVVLHQPYATAILREVIACFPGQTFTVKRAYCNVVSFGDVLLPHRDARVAGDVTALLYVNETWDRAWGGETILYNDAGDAVHAVSPRPGRLLLFRSVIEHRGSAPSRLCLQPRLTLAFKLAGMQAP